MKNMPKMLHIFATHNLPRPSYINPELENIPQKNEKSSTKISENKIYTGKH